MITDSKNLTDCMVVYRYRLSVYVDTVYSMYGYYSNTMFVYEVQKCLKNQHVLIMSKVV